MYTRLLILLMVSMTSGRLWADAVAFTTSEANGKISYQFTLTNTGATGGTLFDLFLRLPTDIANIDATTIGKPVGWGDPVGGLLFFGPDISPSTSFIEWAADFSGVHDVPVGGSLSGFSFAATQQVGIPITFALNGSTEFLAAQQTTPVPEPDLFIPLLAVLAVIGFVWRVRDLSDDINVPHLHGGSR